MISLAERFAKYVSTEKTESGCILWKGCTNPDGYGEISNKETGSKLAHRVAWMLKYGKISKNILVLHSCDNPPCVNTEHLFTGTKKDNSDDKVKKGRQSKEESHGQSKITKKIVLNIRKKYKSGKYTYRKMGEEFGLSFTTIAKIVNKKIWKNV